MILWLEILLCRGTEEDSAELEWRIKFETER